MLFINFQEALTQTSTYGRDVNRSYVVAFVVFSRNHCVSFVFLNSHLKAKHEQGVEY